jgi:hypothetical protein
VTDPTRLNADTVEKYFDAGVPVPLRLSGEPQRILRIDPPSQQIELWTPVDGPEPDVAHLARLTLGHDHLDGEPCFVLMVDARNARYEAYSVLAAIIDDLTSGRPLVAATARSLETYGEILERLPRISEETTLGLIGELLVLEHLVHATGEQQAVRAWLGPGREEHDFVLDAVDAEVKTTLSERRSHLIGSETQLQLSPGRPLWLISLQLTRAGAASQGFGLAETINRLRRLLAVTRSQMDGHLGAVGWRDIDANLYPERYVWRTRPAAYKVDDRFPAITRVRLDSVVPQPEFVGQVSYRVDVTSLATDTPPGVLGAFVRGTHD